MIKNCKSQVHFTDNRTKTELKLVDRYFIPSLLSKAVNGNPSYHSNMKRRDLDGTYYIGNQAKGMIRRHLQVVEPVYSNDFYKTAYFDDSKHARNSLEPSALRSTDGFNNS
jgi:hypothetical protein